MVDLDVQKWWCHRLVQSDQECNMCVKHSCYWGCSCLVFTSAWKNPLWLPGFWLLYPGSSWGAGGPRDTVSTHSTLGVTGSIALALSCSVEWKAGWPTPLPILSVFLSMGFGKVNELCKFLDTDSSFWAMIVASIHLSIYEVLPSSVHASSSCVRIQGTFSRHVLCWEMLWKCGSITNIIQKDDKDDKYCTVNSLSQNLE